ncbi:FAD binding domain-containing protein [Agrobacterium sp. NPDC058088]|uniref:FAD binding domain-containing protein n=1 Tax=Agrobacterium sp. NPDC058088 TaxID=3346335 RepID=UPI0036DE2B40
MPISLETYDRVDLAADALAAARDARVLGGGTLLMRAINYGDQTFGRVIRSTDPALNEVSFDGRRIRIGARLTMAGIMREQNLDFLAPAARLVGGPAIRNVATLGGNLFAPHPYGDLATALLVLDCKVQVAARGVRSEYALEELLQGRDRGPQPFVASVTIDRPGAGEFRYLKVSRVKPKGIAVITIAAWLPVSAGRIAGARIAYGAMASTPVRVPAVERALEGRTLNETGISLALAAATEGIEPPTDALASTWYRKQVAPVHLKRLLMQQAKTR